MIRIGCTEDLKLPRLENFNGSRHGHFQKVDKLTQSWQDPVPTRTCGNG